MTGYARYDTPRQAYEAFRADVLAAHRFRWRPLVGVAILTGRIALWQAERRPAADPQFREYLRTAYDQSLKTGPWTL